MTAMAQQLQRFDDFDRIPLGRQCRAQQLGAFFVRRSFGPPEIFDLLHDAPEYSVRKVS
jgi:hypothetical protein